MYGGQTHVKSCYIKLIMGFIKVKIKYFKIDTKFTISRPILVKIPASTLMANEYKILNSNYYKSHQPIEIGYLGACMLVQINTSHG